MRPQSPFKKDLSRLQHERTRELIFRNVNTFGFSPDHLGIAASSTMDCGLLLLYAAARLSTHHSTITPADVLVARTEASIPTLQTMHETFNETFPNGAFARD